MFSKRTSTGYVNNIENCQSHRQDTFEDLTSCTEDTNAAEKGGAADRTQALKQLGELEEKLVVAEN